MPRHRPALVVGAAVLLGTAAGCSDPPAAEPAGPEASSPEASPAEATVPEFGAWHELVATRAGVLLVNGHPEGEPAPDHLELWRWDGAWSRVETEAGPSGRNFAGVAYDPRSDAIVVHGGLTAEGASAETWIWDGSAWTRAGAAEGEGPGPRSSPAMAFDEASGLTVLYGGDDGSEQYADTWTFDGSTWRRAARIGPTPVRWPAVLDGAPGGGVVLYGGHQVEDEDGAPAIGDTWLWRAGQWQQVPGADQPGPLVNAAGVVHPAHGLLLVGGGDLRGRDRGRIWRWTGSGWATLPPGLVPGRQAFGAAYDPDRDVVVLTGGLVEPGSLDRHQDVWEWSGDPGTPAEQVD